VSGIACFDVLERQACRKGRGDTLPVVPELEQPSPEPRRDAHRLYRNRQRPELICTVPDGAPLPAFVAPSQWAFEQMLWREDLALAGFRDRPAAVDVRVNGFYMLQTCLCCCCVRESPSGRSPCRLSIAGCPAFLS